MSPKQGTPESANSAGAAQLAARPPVIEAADVNEVMRDQLEILIGHAEDGVCGCEQCERYLRARALLMELFTDSKFAAVKRKASAAAGH